MLTINNIAMLEMITENSNPSPQNKRIWVFVVLLFHSVILTNFTNKYLIFTCFVLKKIASISLNHHESSEQSLYTFAPTSFAVQLHTHFTNSRSQRFVFENVLGEKNTHTHKKKTIPSVESKPSNMFSLKQLIMTLTRAV